MPGAGVGTPVGVEVGCGAEAVGVAPAGTVALGGRPGVIPAGPGRVGVGVAPGVAVPVPTVGTTVLAEVGVIAGVGGLVEAAVGATLGAVAGTGVGLATTG